MPKQLHCARRPEDLLSAVTSEIQDPRDRISKKSYLPHEEEKALKELQKPQKEKHIVIKGAGMKSLTKMNMLMLATNISPPLSLRVIPIIHKLMHWK